MINRSNFPVSVDTFQTMVDILASDKTNVQRYQTLLLQETRTTEEETEFNNLKTTLINKIISSEHINFITDAITNMQDYYLNEVVAHLATLDVGVLRADVGELVNLITADKTSLVDAINEVQSEFDNHTHNIATANNNGFMSKEMASKLSDIAVGAEVNQNAFGQVNVDGNIIYSDSEIDELKILSGSNISLTSNPTTDTITISAPNVLAGTGERIEIHEVSFYCNGVSIQALKTANFITAFSSPPRILPMNITEVVSYADDIKYPYIYSVTTTSFTVRLATIAGNSFGAGTIKMYFMAIGK